MPFNKRFLNTLYNPDWLSRVYVEEDRNAAQVAALIGCTRGAVLDSLRRNGIPVKDSSEAQKKAKYNRGSDIPRPKLKYKNTLHNPTWMSERTHLSDNALAEEVGSSVGAVIYARRKLAGILPKKSEEEKTEQQERFRSYQEARKICPPGFCVLCEGEGEQVNHINRAWRDNRPENLERLCLPCHRHQHAAEDAYMLELVKSLGYEYRNIWKAARDNIVSGKFSPQNRPPGQLTIDGETKALEDWAESAGIQPSVLRARLVNGWDPKEAVSTPKVVSPTFTVRGVTATIAEHSKLIGLPYHIIKSRMARGWPVDKAITIPLGCGLGWEESER